MSKDIQKQIESILENYCVPHLNKDLMALAAVESIDVNDGSVLLKLRFGFPCAGIEAELTSSISTLLETIPEVKGVAVDINWKINAHAVASNKPLIPKVRNIIAVGSGKGGVGKSTSSVNLALALKAEGARVAILDADIYGPSLPLMLGIPEDVRPRQVDGKYFVPITSFGLQSLSMGNLVSVNTPIVWRGPKVSGALLQMLQQTVWDEVDYLIIDLPPGTGDIQLTLAQNVPVTAAVIVTTPQDIALLDARKAIEMFNKVDIPVLGIIENMSVHTCSNCGHKEHIFGQAGAERIAKEYDTALLGALPLDLSIRKQGDLGVPIVVAEPDSDISEAYREIARNLSARLSLTEKNKKII